MPPKASSVSDKKDRISIIRFIYLYLITAITFIVFIIGAVTIVDVVLKAYVFNVDEYDYGYDRPVMICEKYAMGAEGEYVDNPNYEDCLLKQKASEETYEKENTGTLSDESARRLSIGIAQVFVAFPLWIFHWRIIERDRKERRKK